MRSGSIIGIGLVAVIVIGGLWQRDYKLEFWPHGPGTGMITRSHPLRKNKFVLVRWTKDPDYGEIGWCVWAAAPGEKPQFHLVLHADGETVMATRPEWWKD